MGHAKGTRTHGPWKVQGPRARRERRWGIKNSAVHLDFYYVAMLLRVIFCGRSPVDFRFLWEKDSQTSGCIDFISGITSSAQVSSVQSNLFHLSTVHPPPFTKHLRPRLFLPFFMTRTGTKTLLQMPVRFNAFHHNSPPSPVVQEPIVQALA